MPNKAKILVVEDEIIVADNICETLEELGHEALEPAIHFAEALESIKEEKPDLIFLDIRLAGKRDGIDLAKVIESDFQTPYIFLTSHADPATVERAKNLNPGAYLLKPFTHKELYAAIELTLAKALAQNPVVEEKQQEFEKVKKEALFIKENKLFHKVNFKDVTHIKSDHVYLEYHTQEGKKFVLRGSLKEHLEELPPYFFQTHRSFIVNLNFLDAINSLNVIIKGEKVPIGKKYRDELMENLNIEQNK